MSPDWAAAPTTVPYAKFGDPQSLNLYSYVENGPINLVDADGHGQSDGSAPEHARKSPDTTWSVSPSARGQAQPGLVSLSLTGTNVISITPAMLNDSSQDASGVYWIQGLSPLDILREDEHDREMAFQVGPGGKMRDTSLADAFSFAGGKFLAKALDGIVETIAARIGVGFAEELTYAEIRGALNLTEGMSKSASRRLIADIGMNGLKDKVIKLC
jgi:hypothetical protein